jgi:hypothetical protein
LRREGREEMFVIINFVRIEGKEVLGLGVGPCKTQEEAQILLERMQLKYADKTYMRFEICEIVRHELMD